MIIFYVLRLLRGHGSISDEVVDQGMLATYILYTLYFMGGISPFDRSKLSSLPVEITHTRKETERQKSRLLIGQIFYGDRVWLDHLVMC